MTIENKLRGHHIEWSEEKDCWLYSDTKEPTYAYVLDCPRACGHCGEENTPEGYDACLGTLPEVMNACCGHGDEDMTYIQFSPGYSVHGKEATRLIKKLKEKL